jgi:glycosyltransferase involved in cell wall biosynthesis
VKIGIYDPYLDTLGGGEKYMLTIAECLSKNHEVSVFWDDGSVIDRGEKRFMLDLTRVTTVPDIFSQKSGLVRRFSATRKYDLIIYLSDGSVPTVFSKQLFLHFQFPTEWIHSLSPQEKIKLLRVNKIICNAKYTQKYIEELFGRECVLLYPPVDVEHSYEKTEKQNIILSVGRYTALPGGNDFKKLGFLTESFKKLSQDAKGWRFIIATTSLSQDDEHIDLLKQSVEEFPIEIFRDIPREKLLNLYKKAKIYWHAAGYGEDLEKHPERAEHFGIVTVEAMNRGAVPVVFNAGGQREIVSNGRSGYLWRTPEDLLEKTEFLMRHEKDRIKLSKNAFEDSLQYDKKKFCQKLSSLL